MEQTQFNFLNMTGNVIAAMRNEETLWMNEPEVKAGFEAVETDYRAIISKSDQVSGMNKTGHTSAKNNVFDSMCAQTYKLCRKMAGYAKTRNDKVLLAQVDLSLTAISRGPELEVISRCAGLADLAETNLTKF